MRLDNLTVEYHDTLNPILWKGEEMRLEVRVTLLKSAYAFIEFLELDDLKINGVHFVGSNASFNYTDYSDCDIHIVVDFEESPCGPIADNFFQTKKALWNKMHEAVKVKGYPVELYVEDVNNPVQAAGVYDLIDGKWLSRPEREEPLFDSSAVLAKVDSLGSDIEAICKSGDKDDIGKMFERLRTMRKSGLVDAGEFSTENLAFKTLRNLGFISMLADARLKAQDGELTLEDGCPICETPEGGLQRCTVQTVNAFAAFYHFQPITRETDIPITGEDVVNDLREAGLKMQVDPTAVGKSLNQWVPAHRVGTWYVSTDGHAMALINGELVDAEHKGVDNRRIVAAVQFKR